jgi:hypothetical protein
MKRGDLQGQAQQVGDDAAEPERVRKGGANEAGEIAWVQVLGVRNLTSARVLERGGNGERERRRQADDNYEPSAQSAVLLLSPVWRFDCRRPIRPHDIRWEPRCLPQEQWEARMLCCENGSGRGTTA